MSEFAFFRFRSHNMLTKEEEEHKEEIVQLTEGVLQAKGIQCDARISKIPEEELREILEKVRRLRKNKKLLNKKRVTHTRVGDRNGYYNTLAFNAWYRYIVSLFVLRIPIRTI